jgi:Domain of unknown function (DUF4430)
LARTRPKHLAAALAVLATIGLGAAQPAAAAAPVHVKVRVEGPTSTITQSDPVPLTGTFAGHQLSTPTALGALLKAGRAHHFKVGLQWFDCCGFFVNSIAGIPGDSTHFWAFKVNQKLSSVGAGSIPATPGLSVLFYYTTFDPNTGATQPTLGLNGRTTATVDAPETFTIRSFNDAGKATPAPAAWLHVGGIAVHADSTGHVTVAFGHSGTFAVRATRSGAIRSRTIWVHFTSSASAS